MGQIHRESLTRFETVTLDYQIPVWKEGSNKDATLKRITLRDFFASDVVSTVVDPPNWATNSLIVTDNHTHNFNGKTLTFDGGTQVFGSSLTFRVEGDIFIPSAAQDDALTKLAVLDSSTGQIKWRNSSTLSGNYFDKTSDDTDDITEGINKFVTAAHLTKLGHISVTQAVDLDQMESDIAVNSLKVSNVSTNLSEGTVTNTTVDINSSDGTNATLASASTSRAGLLSKAKFDEIEANSLKVSNQPTDLSEGTSTNTTVDVNSSDGTNATLQPASTLRAGLMSKAKFDEVVANNAKVTNATHTGEVTGSGALTIADDVVDEANLKVGNSPTNGHVLTARSTESGGLKWEAVSASVADGDYGDIVVSSSGTAWTIDNSAVTVAKIAANNVNNSKLAVMSANTIKGAITGGNCQDLTATEVRTMLNVEDGADVTDTTNVTAAGALMDSEVTNLAQVKSFDSADYATAAQGTLADSAQQPPSEGAFVNGDKTKLDGIETGATADQTDSEIETAYNNQVDVVSQVDAEAGTSTDVKRWTPQRVKQAIDALGSGATNLSEGTTTNTTVDINSNTGTNATLAEASTTRAGVMSKAKFDEVVANTAKVTNATHTGDVTGSTALTIADNAVTYAKMQNVAANNVLLGNDDGAGSDPQELTAAEVRTLLNVSETGDAANKPTLSKTIVLESPADADYIPIFRTDVAITIQEALGALLAAGDVDIRLYHDTDLANTSPTAIGAQTTLTTTTEAAVDISTDATIPANSWIFLDVGTVATPQTTVVNIRYTED